MTSPRFLNIFAAILLSIGFLTSCEDDRLYDPSFIGEGESVVSADITFTPLTPALESRAVEGGTPGNAIRDINTLCIAFYNSEDNSFVNSYFYNADDIEIKQVTDNPSDANYTSSNNPNDQKQGVTPPPHRAEETTARATVRNLRIPYGKYKIYAIANIDKNVLTDEFLSDIENVKKKQFEWNTQIAQNNQMFGYFSNDDKSNGFDAPEIIISRPSSLLKAWIKRTVSKVTVAFDGSNLYKGVEIFIKSVTIMDIPKYCYLGADNPYTPAETEQKDDPKNPLGKLDLIENSGQEMTYYPDGVNPDNISKDLYNSNWPGYISKEHPVNGYDQSVVNSAGTVDEKLVKLHSETMNAFYFFENLQGKGTTGTPTDKRQQVIDQHKTDHVVSYPEGVDPDNIAWKDAKKYGTYIVVKAYYKSNDKEADQEKNEGQGEITYRFMLGKDTHIDYNAERNHHFKLTLRFNGWANDVDWHIDYKKETPPKMRFPHPFYISYLYGQPSMIPIEFDAPKDVTISKVEAEITENNWSPLTTEHGWDGNFPDQPTSDLYDEYYRWVSSSILQNKPWNGFLALKKPQNILVLPEPKSLAHTEPSVFNKDHYENPSLELKHRTYNSDATKLSTIPLYQAIAEDKIHVSWDNGTYFVKVPIWTRARNMIKRTAYTGNNPFFGYYRNAKVNIKITLSNGTVLDSSKDFAIAGQDNLTPNIDVRQVRRLVNPKGIYRKEGSTKPFNVTLKVLTSASHTTFTDLQSDGPWRAYVIRDTEDANGGFVELTDESKKTTTANYTFEYSGEVFTRKSIEGADNSVIKFDVNFKNTPSSKPKYAIIRVEYNYYSCYHLIFIRQGYQADDTFGDGNKWCTGNNIDQNTTAENPLNEGSLFRFGNWDGIKSENNKNWKSSWTSISPDDFTNNAAGTLSMTDGTSKKWTEITPLNTGSGEFPSPGGGRRIATHDDFAKLVPSDLNNADAVSKFPIKCGYGILYGDGATKTASTIEEAYGHQGETEDSKGMRGCFVYDTRTGANLFFPIGSSGYGHRKNSLKNGALTLRGVLRYSCSGRWGYFDAQTSGESIYKYGVYDAPLFFDVFRSEGAIYWFDKEYYWLNEDQSSDKGEPVYSDYPAWDFNYSTFDFNHISRVNVADGDGSNADACFVRCIEN